MGSTVSSQRRKASRSLDRGQQERRSLRSITRRSLDKIASRTGSDLSLPGASRPVTLHTLSDAEQVSLRRNLGSPADSATKPAGLKGTDSQQQQQQQQPSGDSCTRTPTNSSGVGGRGTGIRGVTSPFTVITSQEVLDSDDDYKSVSDFLSKHYYASTDAPRTLTRVSRISERLNGCRDAGESPSVRAANSSERVLSSPSTRSCFSLCDLECNRSLTSARDEMNELNSIEYKMNSLMGQDRRRNPSSDSVDRNSQRVSFTLSNGSEQETHTVPLNKAAALIAERKAYLEKKIQLESSHCQRVKQILGSESPASQPPTPTARTAATLTSTPSFSKTRKPRALSLVESADGIVGLDSSSYANLMQDVKDVKTLLFRLQGILHQVSVAVSSLANPASRMTLQLL